MAIQQMRIKQPTTTWSSRRTGQLVDKTAHEIKEVYFGSQMINLAKETKAYIFKLCS